MNGSGSERYAQSYRLEPIGNVSAAGMWRKTSKRQSGRPASSTSTRVDGILGQAIGQDATGGAAADDDDVVSVLGHRAMLPAGTGPGFGQPRRKWSCSSIVPWSSIERTRNDVGWLMP